MNTNSVIARTKALLVLLVLMLIDIGPVPTTSMICIFIVIFRPRWFREVVERIYGEG